MKKILVLAFVSLLVSPAWAEHAYISFDEEGNAVISGPFNAIIPKPDEQAQLAGPVNTESKLGDESLKSSIAAYYGTDSNQFLTIQVETTDGGVGTLTDSNMPKITLAGQEFSAYQTCTEINQDELNQTDNRLYKFMDDAGVQLVPGLYFIMLYLTNDEGTAEAIVRYSRNAPQGCSSVTDKEIEQFNAKFEAYVQHAMEINQ